MLTDCSWLQAATPIDKMFHSSLKPSGETAEIWSAPSLIPASGDSAAADNNVWWTVLAVDIGAPFPLEPSDLVAHTASLNATDATARSAAMGPMKVWRMSDPACAVAGAVTDQTCVQNLTSPGGAGHYISTGVGPPAAAGCQGKPADPTGCFPEHKFKTFSVSPVCGGTTAQQGQGAAGGVVSLLGEVGKFVAASPDRLSAVVCGDDGVVDVSVVGVEAEHVQLLFWTECKGRDSEALAAVEVVVGADGKGRASCSCASCREQQ